MTLETLNNFPEEDSQSSRSDAGDAQDTGDIQESGASRSVEVTADRSARLNVNLPEAKLEIANIREEFARTVTGIVQVEKAVLNKVLQGEYYSEIVQYISGLVETGVLSDTNGTDIVQMTLALTAIRGTLQKVYDEVGSDDTELFRLASGRKPNGRIQIVRDPLTLYVRCEDITDYALFNSGKTQQGNNEKITRQDIWNANMSGGVSTPFASDMRLKGLVTAENSGLYFNAGLRNETLIHERQHTINRRILMHAARVAMFRGLEDAVEKKDYLRVRELAHTVASFQFDIEVSRTMADEIIAQFSGGRDQDEVKSAMALPSHRGGLYDYINHPDIKSNTGKIDGRIIKKSDRRCKNIIQQEIKKVFSREYQIETVRSGIGSFSRLLQRGFTREELSMLFRTVPLRRWEKISKRIAETRYFPVEKFYCESGLPAAAISEDGELIFGNPEYDIHTGLCYFHIESENGTIEKVRLNLQIEALKNLNYPFKSAEEWVALWNALESEKVNVNDLAQIQPKEVQPEKGDLLSALDVWQVLRGKVSGVSSETKQLFGVYRSFLRRNY